MLHTPSLPSKDDGTPVIENESKLPALGPRDVPTLLKLSRILNTRDGDGGDDHDHDHAHDGHALPELEPDDQIANDASFSTSVLGEIDSGYDADCSGYLPRGLYGLGIIGERGTENESMDCDGAGAAESDSVVVAELTIGKNGDGPDPDNEDIMNGRFNEPVLAEFKRVPLPVLLVREQDRAVENAAVASTSTDFKPNAKSCKSKVSLPHLHDAISLLWAIDASGFDNTDLTDLANTSFTSSSVSVVDATMEDDDWRPVDYQPDYDFQVAMDSWTWEEVPGHMLDYVVGNPVPRRVVLGGLQYFFREYRKIRED
ncbi:hypothetical protein V1517DRAFT_202835 [Lipomyces orientalis]|uniref:Uncharacterized protein n=1 Tax=Lipomyces orientalis TaxID=1233043 RepID=A0ACC3TVJ1_9ASCO